MANARSVLSQLLQWIPRYEFQIGVDEHDGDKGVRRRFEGAIAGKEIRGNQRQCCCKSADLGCPDCVFVDDGSEVSIKAGMGHTGDNGGFDGNALCKQGIEKHLGICAEGKMRQTYIISALAIPNLTGQ